MLKSISFHGFSWGHLISSVVTEVKIGDGSVQTLCVGASDRCKDAAERFISENSLKATDPSLDDFYRALKVSGSPYPSKLNKEIYNEKLREIMRKTVVDDMSHVTRLALRSSAADLFWLFGDGMRKNNEKHGKTWKNPWPT